MTSSGPGGAGTGGPEQLARLSVLLGAPLVLAGLSLLVPGTSSQSVFSAVAPVASRWVAVHAVMLPFLGLMGLAVCLLTGGLSGVFVWLSRLCAGAFVLFYGAYEAISGLAAGVLVKNAAALPASEQAYLAQSVQDLLTSVEVGSLMAIKAIGEFGWLLGIFFAVAALRQAGKRPQLFLLPLVFSALLLLFGLQSPWGTLAFLCFLLGAGGLELLPKRDMRAVAVRGHLGG